MTNDSDPIGDWANVRVLRWTLYAGAFLDGAFGAPLLAAPSATISLAGFPPCDELLYARMVGLMLLVIGAMYALTARSLRRMEPLIWLAIGGRASGAALYAAHVLFAGAESRLLLLALVNAALAASHLVGWRLARRRQ